MKTNDGSTSASAKSGSEQAERAREEQEQEPRAKRRSAALPPSHDLHHVSTLAPELGVHVGLSHLAVAKLATPAVTLPAVLGSVRGGPGAMGPADLEFLDAREVITSK